MPGNYTNTTAIVAGQPRNASPVKTAIDALDDQLFNHDVTHIRAGTDEIDGDKLDIDWNPANSTPAAVTEADNVDHLSAHLKGIDDALGGKAASTHNHNASDINAGTLLHERGGLEADISAYDGLPLIAGGATSQVKCNRAATAAPSVNDDSGDGYSIMSIWVDTTNDKIYMCTDATPTAAVWKELSPAGVGGAVVNFTDLGDVPASYSGAAGKAVVVNPGGTGLEFGASGGVIDVDGVAGESMTLRNFIYLAADDKWYNIDLDASPIDLSLTCGVLVTTGTINADDPISIRVLGLVDNFTGLDAWEPMYAHASTAGGYIQTKPSPVDDGVQVVEVKMGYAVSTTEMMVDAVGMAITFMVRDSIANNGTLTANHFSDPAGRLRQLRAYLSSSIPGVTIDSYASSNYSTDVALEQRSVATYTADQCTGGTPSSSTSETGFSDSNAFDNNNTTVWFPSPTPGTSWIQYTFGSAKIIRRYTIRTTDNASFLTASPKDFVLQYWNGSAWVTVDTQTNQTGWTTSQIRTFTPAPHSASSTQWRIQITANNGHANYTGCAAEIEMLEAATYTTEKQKLSQSFTVGSTVVADTATLYLKKTGSPTGTLTLSIEADSAGNPSGTPLATATISESSLSTSYADVLFNFGTNPTLTAGTYHLVLDTDRSTSEVDYVQWGADNTSPGHSGAMKSFNVSWSTESADAVFSVLGESTAYDAPLRASSWGAGSGEVEFVHADSSLANRDTASTVKNTTGATADITLVVEIE